MILIVGLGNPSEQYQLNLHNIGFMVVDYLVNNLKLEAFTNKFNGLCSVNNFNTKKVIFLKPLTYMNLSGTSVLAISSFYKITPDNIITIQDDIDLPKGQIRYRFDSGHGGHNGIRDIQDKIGSKFHRLKIGVGRPPNHYEVSDYVLSNFSKEDLKTWIPEIFTSFSNNINYIINKDFKKFIELNNNN
ncbi:aminoacyl-tRNA hydrolase [Rickettsiales bacterium LUAb2]